MSSAAEEILYPALEDFRLDVVMGQGVSANTLTLTLAPFTLVGATTRTGLLTSPLRDRFGMTFRLDYYDPGQLAQIVKRSARILGVTIGDDAAEEIAGRSRGTPRIANRILRRVRDVAQVRHQGSISIAIAREALELLEVDEAGLERIDAYCSGRSSRSSTAAPWGSRRSASLGESRHVEDVRAVHAQLGFIQRTPRGVRHELGARTSLHPREQPSSERHLTPFPRARTRLSSTGSSGRCGVRRVGRHRSPSSRSSSSTAAASSSTKLDRSRASG